MTEAVAAGNLEPTQDERNMAMLAHALQLIGSWIAPLIIFLVNRKSRFVSFHALQALLLQVVHVIVVVISFVGWFVLMFTTLFVQGTAKPPGQPPVVLFLLFPLLWLVLIGTWITILIFVIIYTVKAGRGEWAEYPVLGRIARNLLKM